MQISDRSGLRSGSAGQRLRRLSPSRRLAVFLLLLLPSLFAQTALLQVRVIEGDGAVHAPGTRAAHALVVEVTDETGAPVPQATVNFRVPGEGSSGVFGNGLRTDLATTDPHGRAALPPLQFNRTPGELAVRITAARDAARSSVVSTQYISVSHASPRKKSRLVAVGLALAGSAGASIAILERGGSRTAAASDPNALAIGTPAISIGKPK